MADEPRTQLGRIARGLRLGLVEKPCPPGAAPWEKPTHLRFIGARVYCSVVGHRVRLGDDHHYGDAFTCPGCGTEVPGRSS